MDKKLAKLIEEKTPPLNQRYAEQLRVVHFNNAKSGHGLGTIVAYNGVPKQMYIEENFSAATELAAKAGLANAVVNSMYDGVRCPYVVQWDNGYKDVYEHSSLTPYDPNNPDHDPGPQVKIRLHRGGLDESMETAALIRAGMDEVRAYLRQRLSPVRNIDTAEIKVAPYGGTGPDDRIGWKQTYIITVDGSAVAYTDGPVV